MSRAGMWKVLDARALQEELTSGSDIVAGELLRADKGVVETPRERTPERKAVAHFFLRCELDHRIVPVVLVVIDRIVKSPYPVRQVWEHGGRREHRRRCRGSRWRRDRC